MKKLDIPNEENSTLSGHKKVMYAPNNEGVFERINYGSSIEEYATKQAVNEYEELKAKTLQEIKNNNATPIEYFMYENRMDLPTLASVTGFFQFTIKRDLKVKNYKKLNDKRLAIYANAFGIEIKDLKEFNING